jgi:hypothetical protein
MKLAALIVALFLAYLIGYNDGNRSGYKQKKCEDVPISQIKECLEE